MKIANYKNIPHDYEQILVVKGEKEWPETSEDFVRISEYLEVEFIPRLDQAEIITKKVGFIDSSIEELFSRIESLKIKKQELLCLPGVENETV